MAFVSERKRFWIVTVLLLGVAVVIGYRLVVVHLKLVDISVRDPRYWFTREVPGLRGGIYSDVGGRQPFACSVPVWEYHVDPKSVNLKAHSRESVVQTVAGALNMDVNKVRDIFWRVDSRYVYLGTSFDDAAHRLLSDPKKVCRMCWGSCRRIPTTPSAPAASR